MPSGSGITAFIGKGTNVNYNLPMAASFGCFTNSGALSINTNGFIIESAGSGVPVYLQTNSILTINSNGVVIVTNSGAVTILSSSATAGNSAAVNVLGGTLIVTNSGNFNLGEGLNSDNNIGAAFTNINGNVTISSQFAVKSRDSRFFMTNGTFNTLGGFNLNVTANDLRQFFRFTGGTANLGNITVARATTAGGVSIEGNAVVNSSSIKVGTSIASGYSRMNGGIWTNAGAFYIGDRTAPATGTRRVFFVMNGGDLVTTGADGIVINNQGATSNSDGASNDGGELDVNGGTITTEGIYLNGPSVTQYGYARFALTGGTIYIGTNGVVANTTGTDMTVAFTISGGTLAAKADYTNNANATVSGPLTVKAADAAGNPFNIYANGIWSGGGSLTKTGNGILTLDAADTYAGNTVINSGKLALGASGSINNSAQIILASGATFDVSAPSYTLPANKTLAGMGVITGNVAFASTSILKPGSNTVTGTLSFSNSITQSGGVVNQFDLSTNPSGPNNDLVVVAGDVNISGSSNTLEITGSGPANSIHPLFNYYGTFNGDFSSFTLSGPSGYLTNITTTTPKSIAFVVAVTVRGPTNVAWVGNDANNVWDVLNTTNWLNAGNLDHFVTSDNVTFGTAGLANSNVIIAASVAPASVSVNAAGNYVFDGPGSLGGLGGITKTNAGKLTILNTNNFSGGVSINQGTVSVASLADDNTASPLGQTGTLLLDGGTLEYTGPNATWTRTLTLGSASGSVAIPSGITLTHSGSVAGTGPLIKANIGSLTLSAANSYSGGTLVNAGTLTLNNATAAGGGDITLNGGNLALGAVKPANTIIVAADAQVSGGNAGGLTGIKNITGSSNLVISVTVGVFDLIGDMAAYSGTITLANAGGAGVRLQGAIGSALATWDLGSSTMDLMIRSGSTLNNFGALKGSASTTLSGRGGSSNNGPTTHVIGAIGSDTTFDGAILNGSGGSSATTSIVKVGAGTLTLTGNNLYSGTTVVSNGVIALSGSGALAASSSINVVAGGVIDTSARTDGALALASGQTLRGNGTLRGSVSGGRIAPGNAANTLGQLTITNVADFSSATVLVDLNRTNAVFTNDLITAGSFVLGGTLTVTNLGPTLVAGDRFVLFSGPITGTFGTVNLPGNLGSVTYTWTDNTAVDGSIQVATVTTVNQTPTNLVTSVSGNTLTLSWPTDHIGWRLQSQTSDLNTGLGSVWVDVAGTASTNSVDITLDPANGAVFYRMVYP